MPRLDSELITRNIATSRERAKELIKGGFITVNGKTASKPAMNVEETDDIISSAETFRYVGRGGLKLEKAVKEFNLSLNGKVCVDIGASTGGFTDCMLQNGAEYVYAVDVGHDQLDEKLRNDNRVFNAENSDIRNIDIDFFQHEIDFISIDVSFISVTKVLPKAFEILKNGGEASVLIKPQFEAGKASIGKKGIVKDKKAHLRVLKEIYDFVILLGFNPLGLSGSGIKGGSGNTEYLIYLKKETPVGNSFDFKKIVDSAFAETDERK